MTQEELDKILQTFTDEIIQLKLKVAPINSLVVDVNDLKSDNIQNKNDIQALNAKYTALQTDFNTHTLLD